MYEMKKIILIIIVFFCVIGSSAQTLKGYSIGGILKDPTYIEENSRGIRSKSFDGSVANLKGRISVFAMKNMEIYKFEFNTDKSYNPQDNNSYSDLDNLAKAVANNYNVTLTKIKEPKFYNDKSYYSYEGHTAKTRYAIYFNIPMISSGIYLSITDIKLGDIMLKKEMDWFNEQDLLEKRRKARAIEKRNKDF